MWLMSCAVVVESSAWRLRTQATYSHHPGPRHKLGKSGRGRAGQEFASLTEVQDLSRARVAIQRPLRSAFLHGDRRVDV